MAQTEWNSKATSRRSPCRARGPKRSGRWQDSTVTPTPVALEVNAKRFGFRFNTISVVSCSRQRAFAGRSIARPWSNIWPARAISPGSMPARVNGEPAGTENVLGLIKKYCPARISTLPDFQRSLMPLKRTSSSHKNRELSAKTSSTRPPRMDRFGCGWKSAHASEMKNGLRVTPPAKS